MSKAASLDLMETLHSALADELIKKIQSGEATASDISNAIKFLKDNGIEAAPVEDGKMANLSKELQTAFEAEENVTPLRRNS